MTLKVLMLPDYRQDNPYQTLLINALKEHDVEVTFPKGYRRVLPILREISSHPDVKTLHLHWTSPYMKGNDSISSKIVYALKFLLDIYLTKQKDIGIVWTVHNRVSHNSRFPQLELWVYQKLAKLVDAIIVHSEAALTEITDAYCLDPSKVSVIPHGHYRDVYPAKIDATEAKKQLGLSESGICYLFFGMLRPYKGIETLLGVWLDNQKLFAEHTLMIIGKALDQDYGQKIQALTEQATNIFFKDEFVPDADIYLYFSAADVTVFPFNQILTSGSLLLAMSYGKPIIAPRLGNIAETLGEASDLLYNPNEKTGLQQAMQTSLNKDLMTFSRQIETACNRLNWHDIAAQTAALYTAASKPN